MHFETLEKTPICKKRAQEHRYIAQCYGPGRKFSDAEFTNLYGRKFPNRKRGSVTPGNYCINRNTSGSQNRPKFLRWLGSGYYVLIDDAKPA